MCAQDCRHPGQDPASTAFPTYGKIQTFSNRLVENAVPGRIVGVGEKTPKFEPINGGAEEDNMSH